MPSYPSSPRPAFLTWANAHTQIFIDNDSLVGLTEPEALAFQTAYNNAQTAVNAQESARLAFAAATNAANQKVADLRKSASVTTRLIKAFADQTNNPGVYDIAQIPPPADPSSIPAPGQPTNLAVELDATTGAITLRWKAVNPKGAAGTSYIVYRRLPADPQGQFQFVGATGVKKFTDNTFTAGPDAVQYFVRGQRSDKAGPDSAIFTVSFGRNSQGQQTAFVAEEGKNAMRLAA